MLATKIVHGQKRFFPTVYMYMCVKEELYKSANHVSSIEKAITCSMAAEERERGRGKRKYVGLAWFRLPW